MLSSLPLLATGCKPAAHVALAVAPPAERLQCAAAGTRPAVPAEVAIDWSKVATVDQAKAEATRLIASIRARERVVTGYILRIEGELFACSNNMAWLRDFFAALPKAP